MGKSNQPNDKLRAEAQEYVDSLPDETAAGRELNDEGGPADTEAWQAESARQQAMLKTKKPTDASPDATTPKAKRGNQPK